MATEKIDIEKLLAEGNAIQITVPTTSMYQFIRPDRDEVIIAPLTAPSELKRGEAALYRRDNGMLVLHRIYRHDSKNKQVFMVGDNQTQIEGPLREDQFRGILVAIKRGSRVTDADDPVYLLLSRLWLWLRPVRPVFWHTHRLLRQCLTMLTGRKKQ